MVSYYICQALKKMVEIGNKPVFVFKLRRNSGSCSRCCFQKKLSSKSKWDLNRWNRLDWFTSFISVLMHTCNRNPVGFPSLSCCIRSRALSGEFCLKTTAQLKVLVCILVEHTTDFGIECFSGIRCIHIHSLSPFLLEHWMIWQFVELDLEKQRELHSLSKEPKLKLLVLWFVSACLETWITLLYSCLMVLESHNEACSYVHLFMHYSTGTLLTAKIALRTGLACNLGGGTHHAFPDYGSGFCILNDLAVTAKVIKHYKYLHWALLVFRRLANLQWRTEQGVETFLK